jgi:signal peptidase I
VTTTAAHHRSAASGFGLLRELACGALAMVALQVFVVQVNVVRGASMEPNLRDGDRLVVDRLGCALGEARRGDIVVLESPIEAGIAYVKRVAGVAGDRVALRGGRLFVNGAPADADACILDGGDLPETPVPDDHVFVLGDNRPASADSRAFGLVPCALLRGVARARLWPPARAAML